ncbi:beta strand repeat-containing protein, partial [Candidatus Omnitrophota bacterium]
MDGQLQNSIAESETISYYDVRFEIGHSFNNNASWARDYKYYFDGTIDEVRASSAVRSAEWIQTEYNNQSDPSRFFSSIGGEQAFANIYLGADITANGSDIILNGNVTRDRVDDVTITTGAGAGNITVDGRINGDQAGRNLTLLSGTGNIDLRDAIGSQQPLYDLVVTSVTNVGFDSTVKLDNNLTQTAGAGTTTFDGTVEVGSAIDITASTIDINAALDSTGATSLTGSVLLGAGITTDASNFTITGNVTRDKVDDVTISTGAGAGDITIDGKIDGDQAGRNLTLTADTGSIEIQNAIGSTQTLNDLTVTSATDVSLTGAAATIDVNTLTIDAAGGVTLDGAVNVDGDIVVNAGNNVDQNADITSQGGAITINAAATNIDMADGTTTSTTGVGTIAYTAGGNVALSILNCASTVDVTAGGAISEQLTGEAANIIGTTATLSAASGVGATDDIDTTISTLVATNSGAGNIAFNETDAIILTDVDTADGAITVTAGGAVVATAVDTGSDNKIDIATTSGDITVGAINSGTGETEISTASGSINDATDDAVVDITAGLVDLDATSGIGNTRVLELDVTDLEATTATGGITLTETDGLDSAVVSTTGAASHINITTGNGGTTWMNVDTAGASSNISLTSGTGTTTITNVDTADGAITISADGQMTATDVVAGGTSRDVTLNTTSGDVLVGSLTAEGDQVTIDSAGRILDNLGTGDINITAGTADLTAATGIGIIGGENLKTDVSTLNAHVTPAGDIFIWNDSSVTLGDVDTSDGKIDISSGGQMIATDVVAGGSGEVWFKTLSGDILIDIIAAADNKIVLDSTGAINEVGEGDESVDITCSDLTLTAQDEIGGADELDIETTVTSLDASSIVAGDLVVTETDAITLIGVDTADGAITVTAGGAITATDVQSTNGNVTLNAQGALTATLVSASDSASTGEYDVVLNTTTGGMTLTSVTADNDITVDADSGDVQVGLITAGDDITLTADSDSIIEDGDGTSDIVGDKLTATAALGIDLDTTVVSLDASVTGMGININETDAIILTDVDSANGTITISAGGAITATDVQSIDGNITLNAQGALTATLVSASDSA